MAKKLVVDPNLCIGCGSCAAVAPKTFIMDDSLGKTKALDPAGDSEKTVQEAIDSCPVSAISYEGKT